MLDTIHNCWFLTGATASGKTQVGLDLAKILDAEIISLDSMAVYREMDIGTDKPGAAARHEVSHHLLDLISPTEEFSVAQYVQGADEAIQQIRGRGRQVLFIGGTPLYLKALLRGIWTGPPPNWEFRKAVADEAKRIGTDALHNRLRQVDPLAAARIHAHDTRRIIRALEVHQATGQPISHRQTQFEEGLSADQCNVYVLQWPRQRLHERIRNRVLRMFEAGLVTEVQNLLDRYGKFSRTAGQAVGYQEVIEHLSDERSLAETIQRVETRTRRFAKRQETWVRSLSECTFVPMDEELNSEAVANRISSLACG